jgi:hypothetical protein
MFHWVAAVLTHVQDSRGLSDLRHFSHSTATSFQPGDNIGLARGLCVPPTTQIDLMSFFWTCGTQFLAEYCKVGINFDRCVAIDVVRSMTTSLAGLNAAGRVASSVAV